MARVLTVTLNPALDLTVQLPALRLGEVNRSDNLQVHAAGKGLNLAQVLADLGHQLTVTGFLGEANAQRPAATSSWPRRMGGLPISMARGWRSAPPSATSC